jgi:Fur family zinc uptake transcriptional regulator
VNGFVACQLHDCGGNEVSIFMLCTQCERAHEFTDTSIDSRLQSLGNDRGFQAAHKVIEITGLCANCQTAETAARKH